MEGVLKFNLPEEQEDFKDAINGSDWHLKFDEVWEQCFRPYYNHGYSDTRLAALVKENPAVGTAIELLGEIYQRIRKDEY